MATQDNIRLAGYYPLWKWMKFEHVKSMMKQNKVSFDVIGQHQNDRMECSGVQAFVKTHANTATSSADMDYSNYGGQEVLSVEQVEEGGEILTKTTFADGDTEYTNQANQVHRVGGPAVIKPNGFQYYYQNSKWHRPVEEGPAWIRPNGTGEYYEHGKWMGSFPPRAHTARQLKKFWH